MTDSSWWDRHLSRAPKAPVAPARTNGGSFPRKAVRWQENYPPVQPRVEDEGYPDLPDQELDNWHKVQRNGFIAKPPPSLKDKPLGDCPGCGGKNYFRRRWANKECAPICTDCGYNGDYFTQSGTLLNAVGIRGEGPTQFARSNNPEGSSTFDYAQALEDSGWNPSAVTR